MGISIDLVGNAISKRKDEAILKRKKKNKFPRKNKYSHKNNVV